MWILLLFAAIVVSSASPALDTLDTEGCLDTNSSCDPAACSRSGMRDFNIANCRRTCNLCSCKDKVESCSRSMCKYPDLKEFVTEKCQLTCRLCGRSATSLLCDDKDPECTPEMCITKGLEKFVAENCQSTCELCDSVTTTTTAPVTTPTTVKTTTVKPISDPDCTYNGKYTKEAVNCVNEMDQLFCKMHFGNPDIVKAGGSDERPNKCFYDNLQKEMATKYCAKTCGYCCLRKDKVAECKDKLDDCFDAMCTDDSMQNYVYENCQKTCNLCGKKPPPGVCADEVPQCNAQLCRTRGMEDFVVKYCKRTCGLCGMN